MRLLYAGKNCIIGLVAIIENYRAETRKIPMWVNFELLILIDNQVLSVEKTLYSVI